MKRVGVIAVVVAVVVLALLGSFTAGYVVRDARSDEMEIRVYREDPEPCGKYEGCIGGEPLP